MKKSLIIHSLITLVCIALALLSYHFYFKRNLQQNIEQQAQASIAEAQKAALQESLRIERVVNAVKATEASLRLDIDLYIFDRGELPKSLSDFNHPDNWQPHPALAKIEMQENLTFILHFNPDWHTTGSIKLSKPLPANINEDLHQLVGTSFDCTTADFAFINDYLPNCQYLPTAK